MNPWEMFKKMVEPERKYARAPSTAGETSSEENVLTDEAKIVSMLMQATDDKTHIQIAFGNKILIYETRFMTVLSTGSQGAGGSEPSSEYLSEKEYILIGAIDPQEGNEKVMTSPSAVILFAQGNKFNEFQTSFIEVVEGLDGKAPNFKMSFPQTIYRKPQRRETVRAKYSEKSRITLRVTREAGVTFTAPIFDVSIGGLCFLLPDGVAPLLEDADVEVAFIHGEEEPLVLQGILVKMGARENKACAQVKFIVDSYETTRKIGELVTRIELDMIQEKKKTTLAPKKE